MCLDRVSSDSEHGQLLRIHSAVLFAQHLLPRH
jgi:hypothetical protein